jgi:hypothetical protein
VEYFVSFENRLRYRSADLRPPSMSVGPDRNRIAGRVGSEYNLERRIGRQTDLPLNHKYLRMVQCVVVVWDGVKNWMYCIAGDNAPPSMLTSAEERGRRCCVESELI